MGQRHLLIVAHGSRRQASNDEVRRLGEAVARLNGSGIDHVEVAFLELDEPDIPQGLERCTDLGASEIVVFPYFLAAGTHVVEDIPEALDSFRVSHPSVRVRLTAHLGASTALPATILDVAAAADIDAPALG